MTTIIYSTEEREPAQFSGINVLMGRIYINPTAISVVHVVSPRQLIKIIEHGTKMVLLDFARPSMFVEASNSDPGLQHYFVFLKPNSPFQCLYVIGSVHTVLEGRVTVPSVLTAVPAADVQRAAYHILESS